jgi:hypothetical protein
MSRKTRRKIRRRAKSRKGKPKRRKNWFLKHLDSPVTNRYTKLTTGIMLIVETLFLIVCALWAYYEVFIRRY